MLTHQRTRALLATTALAAVLATGACAGGGSDSQTSEPAVDRAGSSAAGNAEQQTDGQRAQDADDAANATSEEAGEAAEEAGEAAEPADPQERAVIATGTISLETDDVERARFDVQKVLDAHQGTISHQETTTDDEGELDTARMVLRIPSEDFTEATAALEEVADLTSSTYGEEDVTTEVIDVEARIRAQEQSVRRIEALLAEAENLRTLMSIEQELSRRQAELDSLKSQQKWLADQTDLATITVHLERSPDAEEDDTDRAGFLGGLEDGWGSFVAALGGTAAVLGFLLPWLGGLVLLAGAAWVVLRTTRRRGGVAAATESAD